MKLLQALSVMKCPAYSIMNFVWHSVQFLQVRTEEIWWKILQELGQCGCLWGPILGCCGCLGQMFINFSDSHSMWMLLSLWNTMKIVSFYTMEHLRWLLCNWFWDICTIYKILVVGIKLSLPIVKRLCPFFVLVLKGYIWLYLSLHKPFLTQVDSLFFLPTHFFHKAVFVLQPEVLQLCTVFSSHGLLS